MTKFWDELTKVGRIGVKLGQIDQNWDELAWDKLDLERIDLYPLKFDACANTNTGKTSYLKTRWSDNAMAMAR